MPANAYPQVDGYSILRVIGHGGMSTVYLAEQASLGRKVALKVMLPEALADEVSRGRFENEARTIARLQHPHIVGIYEVGRTLDGLPFYAMPYLPRGHLAQRRLRGQQDKIAGILRALLQALDYAHVRGIVHRDVKAENVLFDETERPLLADFGIALRRGSNPRLTHAGLAVGSTAYMPPEQARGQDVDRRADLYSMGVLTWEALTGQLPYCAGDALSMALKHVQEPIPRLPAPLRHWQGFIDRSMAKKPEDRFASAQDMLDALDALERRAGKGFVAVEVPAPAPAAATGARAPATPRSAPWLASAAAVLLVAIAAAAWIRSDTSAPVDVASTGVAADGLPVPSPGARGGVLGDLAPSEDTGVAAFLANAQQQLDAGRLLAPPNGNAWDSLDLAWRANATHPDTQRLTAALFDALAEASDASLRAGEAAAAKTAYTRARELDIRRGGEGSAVALLRARLQRAAIARFDALLAKPDSRAAAGWLAATDWLGFDSATRTRLLAKTTNATTTPSIAASTTVRGGSSRGQIVVTRADYARFARATGRKPADCGRRNGIFGPRRDWTKVGSDGAPVVCVSTADAEAYAIWLGARDRTRYRLPTAGELKDNPTTPVAAWTTLCADSSCRRRMVSGRSRGVDGGDGHPDIGIRLVRQG